MCDTMVALGNSTAGGNVIFAKNSDRQPNERLITVRVPRRQYPRGAKLKCTYIEIDQVEETCELILLKPHWMWGAEMGGNEYGLNIGNEAVFTKEAKGEASLLGMDMLRLALERCKDCEEAIELLTGLLVRYGQGGNCGYEKKFTYHNSFLIADRSQAWVLETAGIYWAALQVKDIYSISNRLSIGRDFDLSHPDLITHAVQKGWCKGEEDFHFARCYSEPVFTYFSGSRKRQTYSETALQEAKGRIGLATMLAILRGHRPAYEKRPYRTSSVSSVCMHAGFLFGDQTTGSYVVSLARPDQDRKEGGARIRDSYWISGGCPACLALFKPFFLVEGENLSYSEAESEEAAAAWEGREAVHRAILENRIDAVAYKEDRDRLEGHFLEQGEGLDLSEAGDQQLADLVNGALEEEEGLLTRYLAPAQDKKARIRGNPYFRAYWKKMNGALRRGR